MKSKKKGKNYRAAWAPVLADINAQLKAGAPVTCRTAWGDLRVTSVYWSEVTGCMWSSADGRSFCADLSWLQSISRSNFDHDALDS